MDLALFFFFQITNQKQSKKNEDKRSFRKLVCPGLFILLTLLVKLVNVVLKVKIGGMFDKASYHEA